MFLMEKRRNTYFGEYGCRIQFPKYPTPVSSQFSNTPKRLLNDELANLDSRFLSAIWVESFELWPFIRCKIGNNSKFVGSIQGGERKAQEYTYFAKSALCIGNYYLNTLVVYGSIMPKIFLGAPNVLKGFRHPARP